MNQKWAVVTGGGSGLGREICLSLARRKSKILLCDVRMEYALKTAEMARELGASEVRAVRCDVSSFDEMQILASEMKATREEVGLLVNNAGVAVSGPFSTVSIEDWKWILDINLWGVIHGCRVFLPLMSATGGGKILNIASVAGMLSPPEMVAYNVSKAAVIALSESLYAERDLTGVGVTVACPSFFSSSLIDHSRIHTPEAERKARSLLDSSGKTASEIAEACLRAVDRNRLYALPSFEGRLGWWIKRAIPERFAKEFTRMWRIKQKRAIDSSTQGSAP